MRSFGGINLEYEATERNDRDIYTPVQLFQTSSGAKFSALLSPVSLRGQSKPSYGARQIAFTYLVFIFRGGNQPLEKTNQQKAHTKAMLT